MFITHWLKHDSLCKISYIKLVNWEHLFISVSKHSACTPMLIIKCHVYKHKAEISPIQHSYTHHPVKWLNITCFIVTSWTPRTGHPHYLQNVHNSHNVFSIYILRPSEYDKSKTRPLGLNNVILALRDLVIIRAFDTNNTSPLRIRQKWYTTPEVDKITIHSLNSTSVIFIYWDIDPI